MSTLDTLDIINVVSFVAAILFIGMGIGHETKRRSKPVPLDEMDLAVTSVQPTPPGDDVFRLRLLEHDVASLKTDLRWQRNAGERWVKAIVEMMATDRDLEIEYDTAHWDGFRLRPRDRTTTASVPSDAAVPTEPAA